MKLIALAAAAMTAVAVAGSARPAARDGVVVSVSHRPATAEAAEVPEEQPLGFRQWSTTFVVRVETGGDPPCEPLRVSAVWRALLNRRPIDREDYPGDILDAARSVTIPAAAYSGETIEFSAWAVCLVGNVLRPASSRVRDFVRIPLNSCEQGPWRVLAVRGRAELQDDASLWRARFLRLKEGDALPSTDYVRTGPNARLVFGDPRCDGLRLTLFGRSSGTVGRYSRTGKGETASIWGHASATLDRHAQGVYTDTTPSLFLQPLGRRAASFELETRSRLTRVALLRGRLRLRAGSRGTGTFLRAGERVTVHCTADGCRVKRGR